MDDRVTEEVVARWEAFPVQAEPRAVVLLDKPVRVEGVFTGAEFELAWSQGLIRPDPSLPSGLVSLLSDGTGGARDSVLTIAEATSTTAAFRCDRGPRDLPAYRLSVTGLRGFCIALAPELACWWPADDAERQRRVGGVATVDDDDTTVHVQVLAGAPTPTGRLRFHEYETFVVARMATDAPAAPTGNARRARFASGGATGRLTEPLGARVLLSTSGEPLVVTPTAGGR